MVAKRSGRPSWRDKNDFSSFVPTGVSAILIIAMIFGGGGSRYGVMNLVVQLSSLALLLALWADASGNQRQISRPLLFLACASLALPLLQLIPLPAPVWQALPGRELAFETRQMLGVAGDWFPLSLDPWRTLLAFAALIPPLAIIALYRWENVDFSQSILRLIVVLALLNLLVGAFQISSGGASPLPYPILDDGRNYGFFASHNSSGLFSVIALCALIGVKLPHKLPMSPILLKLLVGSVLVVATVLTQSRSSTLLIAVPLGYAGVCWLLAKAASANEKKKPGAKLVSGKMMLSIASIVAALMLAITLASGSRLSSTFERFEDLEDARPGLWADSAVSAERFFPVGSGMGSFDEVFQLDESLETLSPEFARRAHNDYLEIVVEAGVFGLILVFAWLVWAVFVWSGHLKRQRMGAGAVSGLALLCVALQSLLDYPLRNQALLCVAALLVCMLAQRSISSKGRKVVPSQ